MEKLIFPGNYFLNDLKIKYKTDNFNTKYLQPDINLDNNIKFNKLKFRSYILQAK